FPYTTLFRSLVAGDLPRAQDDEVALLELHGRMLAEGEARKRGPRLSLRTGAEDDELARREMVSRLGIDEEVGRAAEIAEVEGEADVLLHGPAEQADLATDGGSGAQHALHPVHVGSEHRHRDAAFGARAGEDARERFAH